MRFLPEPAHKHGTLARVGVLLINLGTPEAPTAPAVRKYLKEFLWDPRVVEIPRPLWWLILNGIVLRTRPKESALKYAKIWTKEGSPLKLHTQKQARLIKGFLGEKSPLVIEYAMRYGTPSIAEGISKLRSAGCDRILAVPLYPQYAASTTASSVDAVNAVLARMRNVPEVRWVKHFHDHPLYIQSVVKSVQEFWSANGRPAKLLMSFHGLPKFSLERGDPYHCECHKSARLIGEALGLKPDQYLVTFQSRFGRAEWLKPYTADAMTQLGKEKTRRLDVICPGFVSDCLETLEEIAIENKAVFLQAGGGDFNYIPCLNERPQWIQALMQIIKENLGGWLPSETEAAHLANQAEVGRKRALAMGAKA
ncbi:MAG: ferrochelatase [Betaproteobacteria bacterium]|nr:ferrochelatase [Betaproteobacteria bacterium]